MQICKTLKLHLKAYKKDNRTIETKLSFKYKQKWKYSCSLMGYVNRQRRDFPDYQNMQFDVIAENKP